MRISVDDRPDEGATTVLEPDPFGEADSRVDMVPGLPELVDGGPEPPHDPSGNDHEPSEEAAHQARSEEAQRRLDQQMPELDPQQLSEDEWAQLEPLYEQIDASPEPLRPVGDPLTLIDNHLRFHAYHQHCLDEVEAHAEAMLAEAAQRVQAYRQRRGKTLSSKLEHHGRVLAYLLTASGKRRIQGVNGTIEFTPRYPDLQKEGKEADPVIVTWLEEEGLPQFIRVKKEPDMKAVKKRWRDTGEIPPGTCVVTVGGHFRVKHPHRELDDGNRSAAQ